MEFEGLKIGVQKTQIPREGSAQVKHENAEPDLQTVNFFVEGTDIGKEILNEVKTFGKTDADEVIYGVYNNINQGISVRFNDFLIDHSRVTLKDKSYFFHMLAVMVDAGMPVVKAVKSLAVRSQNKRFRRVLNTVAHACEQGAKLSDAMSRFEDTFDEAELGIVKSGEATGRLHLMLFKLSDQLDKKHELQSKLWGAAIYPIAVLSVLLLVATGMLLWVFPTLLSLLTEGGVAQGDLPFATRLLVGIQSGLVNFWWLLLLVIFGIYGIFSMYIHSSYGAVRWDYVKLRIPLIGGMIRKVSVLRFISMLGILVEAGLPVITALKITGNSITNRIYKLKIQEVIDSVRVGGKISESLNDSEFLFPAEIVQMLSVGEKSASLGKISEKIADQFQREINNSLKGLMSVFEPVMILFVGLCVAVLALAIMAPIFNLTNVVGT